MTLLFWGALAFILLNTLFVLYIFLNDRRLTSLPPEARAFSPTRQTPQSIRALSAQLSNSPPISVHAQLPPKTGRRYIVVGGGGFLGGWIVSSLLERGEDPLHIRILDIRAPVRPDLASIPFIQIDISDASAVQAAFTAPWPSFPSTTSTTSITDNATPELTVFHTAANIRFYERHSSLLPSSSRINVLGTANVLASARAAGATILIYTSSGSIFVRASRFLLWPWESAPKHFVQVLSDNSNSNNSNSNSNSDTDTDNLLTPKRHEEFFSNYAVTKLQADRLVRAADRSSSSSSSGGDNNKEKDVKPGILRTGCIRPGNGVYGPRGDMLCGAYLVRGTNPTWISNTLQSFCYVENCVLAHLLYEQRLIELRVPPTSISSTNTTTNLPNRTQNPDIGGQAFIVADPGPIPTYGDVYTALETLTDGACTFIHLRPTMMLLVAYLIEMYYLVRHLLVSSACTAGGWCSYIGTLLPPVKGDIVNLQPSLFALTSVHLVFDDSRARLPPERGGLGYVGAWTTMEGLVKTVEEHRSGVGRAGRRSEVAGVSLGFLGKAQRQRGGSGDLLAGGSDSHSASDGGLKNGSHGVDAVQDR